LFLYCLGGRGRARGPSRADSVGREVIAKQMLPQA
jgi:hypothetical protein